MNIDLLIGKDGRSALLCDAPFNGQPLGVIFDALARELIVEFEAGIEPFPLNITVEERFVEKLLRDYSLFISAAHHGEIMESLEVPLVYLNDPYGGKFNERPAIKTHRSVIAFEQFIDLCTFAQPIHRDDLGDERTLSGVLGGEDVRKLEFSPLLARQRDLERAAPHYAPSAMPQMGLGSGASRARTKDGGDTSSY